MALMLRAGWARIPVSSPSRRFHRQFLQAAFPRSASPVTRAAAPAAIQPRPAHCNSKGEGVGGGEEAPTGSVCPAALLGQSAQPKLSAQPTAPKHLSASSMLLQITRPKWCVACTWQWHPSRPPSSSCCFIIPAHHSCPNSRCAGHHCRWCTGACAMQGSPLTWPP